MAVNRYLNHLVIYLEDKPYREFVNGAKTLLNINEKVIDDKAPLGGWVKVLNSLEENLNLINSNQYMHVLLLMDFDNEYKNRKDRFEELLSEQDCIDRVFILGIDLKESEDLKRTLQESNNEAVSELLLKECPHEMADVWKNKHLLCNHAEIARMKDAGIFDWLFVN